MDKDPIIPLKKVGTIGVRFEPDEVVRLKAQLAEARELLSWCSRGHSKHENRFPMWVRLDEWLRKQEDGNEV